jgi:phosphoadenosine phosphosulfate reductase
MKSTALIAVQSDNLGTVLSRASTLQERISIISERLEGRITFSTSLGLEDQAILHAIATTSAHIDVFTLDTGRHFAETLDTIAESEARYGLRIRVVSPEANEVDSLVSRDGIKGFRMSIDARKACCDIRKVRPLRRALAGASAWVTGLRRGQSNGRQAMSFTTYDSEFKLLKVNPLADWSLDMIETYVRYNDVPVNALHAQGYPSIGCQPCTRAIRPGEDIRAGRWWWESEDGKECGLHNRPKQPAVAV